MGYCHVKGVIESNPMLLKPDLRLSRVIRITWKVDLWMIALCSGGVSSGKLPPPG